MCDSLCHVINISVTVAIFWWRLQICGLDGTIIWGFHKVIIQTRIPQVSRALCINLHNSDQPSWSTEAQFTESHCSLRGEQHALVMWTARVIVGDIGSDRYSAWNICDRRIKPLITCSQLLAGAFGSWVLHTAVDKVAPHTCSISSKWWEICGRICWSNMAVLVKIWRQYLRGN